MASGAQRVKGTTMNERRGEFYAKIARDVREHNRSIIGVGADEGEPPFAYTVGNATRDLPELLVLGLAANHGVLNRLSDIMLNRGKRFDDGELVSLGGQFPVKIIDATSPRVRSDTRSRRADISERRPTTYSKCC